MGNERYRTLLDRVMNIGVLIGVLLMNVDVLIGFLLMATSSAVIAAIFEAFNGGLR